jgi:hypothetical protein
MAALGYFLPFIAHRKSASSNGAETANFAIRLLTIRSTSGRKEAWMQSS